MITLITSGIWQFCSRRALQTPDGNKDTGKTNFLSLVCIGKSVLGTGEGINNVVLREILRDGHGGRIG